MSPKSTVPRIPTDQLMAGAEIKADGNFVWHKGHIRVPGRSKNIPVCYKTGLWEFGITTEDMMHEAQILLKLKGVDNVPQLYGITDTPPIALVMSLCPGRPLSKFQRSSSARTYLAAIRETCVVVGAIHRRGVVHCDIGTSSILVVTRRNKEDVSVFLVGFDRAEITKDKITRQRDADCLVFLMHEMVDLLNEASPFYQHRDKLRVQGDITLTGIVKVLCSVMHGKSGKCSYCKKLRPGN